MKKISHYLKQISIISMPLVLLKLQNINWPIYPIIIFNLTIYPLVIIIIIYCFTFSRKIIFPYLFFPSPLIIFSFHHQSSTIHFHLLSSFILHYQPPNILFPLLSSSPPIVGHPSSPIIFTTITNGDPSTPTIFTTTLPSFFIS